MGGSLGLYERLVSPTPQVEYIDYTQYIVDGEPLVKVYGINGCPFCEKLEDHLKAMNVQYTYVDIKKDPFAEMQFHQMNASAVPVVIIKNSLIKGFHKNLIEQELVKL